MSQQKLKRTDDWTSMLQKELNRREKLPEGSGWYTFEQIKDKLKIGNHRMYSFLNELKKNGKLDTFDGFVLKNNKLKRNVWYRLTK